MNDPTLTRRRFMTTVSAAVGTAGMPHWLSAQPAEPVSPIATPDVVKVLSDFVVRGRRVHSAVISEMIELALQTVTGATNSTDAWKSLLKPDDLIAIKCNSSGWEALGVGEPFVGTVIESLVTAGFDRQQIIAVEAGENVYRDHGIEHQQPGWDSNETDFGSGKDQLAAWLNQATAIINIPFLKTHNIAGVTGALKNISHAVVRHPARFHGSHCSPYIPDIVAIPRIREKLRLHLTNGLRIVFDKGPEPRDATTWDGGMILASTDPVAIDTVGREIINSQRRILGMDTIDEGELQTAYLDEANKRKLGNSNFYRIAIHEEHI